MARGDSPLPPFDGWQDLLAARVDDLSAAIAAGRPELFVQQVLWTRAALQARERPPIFLERGSNPSIAFWRSNFQPTWRRSRLRPLRALSTSLTASPLG